MTFCRLGCDTETNVKDFLLPGELRLDSPVSCNIQRVLSGAAHPVFMMSHVGLGWVCVCLFVGVLFVFCFVFPSEILSFSSWGWRFD